MIWFDPLFVTILLKFVSKNVCCNVKIIGILALFKGLHLVVVCVCSNSTTAATKDFSNERQYFGHYI